MEQEELQQSKTPKKGKVRQLKPRAQGTMTRKVCVLSESASKKDQEIYMRLNYLYQLARAMNKVHPGLSRHYLSQFIEVAEKRVIRINQIIKRQICKKCYSFLTKRRIERKRNRKVVLLNVCQYCRSSKKSILLSAAECMK